MLNVASAAGPSGSKKTTKMTRDYFENLKSKELIVNWMIENMAREDLVRCIEKGAVSASDIDEARELASYTIPEEELTDEDINAVEAAQQMSQVTVENMLKRVSKESIRNLINKIKEPIKKKEAIVELCIRSGITRYEIRDTKRGKKIYDTQYNEQIDDKNISGVLNECATEESIKLRKKLTNAIRMSASQRDAFVEVPTEVPFLEPGITLAGIKAKLNNITNLNDKKKAIIELCERSGNNKYSIKTTKKGIKLFDNDSDEQIDDADIDDVLEECAQMEYVRLTSNNAEFGRRMNNNNKKKY